MMKKVAINGFGRIGRLVFRHLVEDHRLEVVGLNDIAPLDNLVYLLRYDSVHTRPRAEIKARKGALAWGKTKVPFTQERDPARLPWERQGADIIIEATGLFTERRDAAKHLDAGAKWVIVTAPAKGEDLTVCMGVNEDRFLPSQHFILSNASCTTNALAPVAKVLNDEFGIVSGTLTTIHAYTASQGIVDGPSKKWRRGRAAAVSMIPTTTGASEAIGKVLPDLEGRIDGTAVRVPVIDGSLIDLAVCTRKKATVEAVNSAFRTASGSSRLKGILGITDEELVSSDIVGMEFSALVDSHSTMVVAEKTVKVMAWYDNEWAYARRVVDLARFVSERV